MNDSNYRDSAGLHPSTGLHKTAGLLPLAVWNVGLAFVVGSAAYWLKKKGWLRI
jgi:hypothetical protein